MKNNTINITPALSAFGAFVPTGSYQKNCKNITVTLLCNCVQEDGSENPTVISYTAEDAAQIYDIVNENGTLGLSKGIVNPSPFSKFGAFVPAGSYQNTSSKITVVIEAQCMGPNNTYLPSMLQFNQQELDVIIDIANTNGGLSLVNCYETLSKQVTTCYLNNLTDLNAVCKSAVLAGGLDPLQNFSWTQQNEIGNLFKNNFVGIKGLGSIDITGFSLTINNKNGDVYSGAVTFNIAFGTVSGTFSQEFISPYSLSPPISFGFSISGYTLQLQGSVSIQVNENSFTTSNLSLNAGTGSYSIAYPPGVNPNSPIDWNIGDGGFNPQLINPSFSQFSYPRSNSESIIQKIVGVITPAILKA